ncbi:MAG TPA: prephenate dehydrogenase/arogenate dehydrogenase family protein [Thermoanaerobaculia bacterium]|jgi:prephenate dehydrogenase|nr:prephenate dehydrogenase/arogenate dehydrogenase family protein [Thermoanaerobaculia bacterium]
MRVLIAGLGLIGGSIGMALRARGWRIAFRDPHVSLDEARRAGAADDEDAGNADLIVLATSVDVAIELLREIDAPLITSVCSVMQPLRAVAGAKNFIAGHPLAGSHESGLAAARPDLFEGKRWFIESRNYEVEELVRDCGAIGEVVDPREHDDAVALTSHLPQVLSTALAAYAQRSGVDTRFAGTGLATFLRLAASDATVWLPIVDSNREAIDKHLAAVIEVARTMDEQAFRDAQAFVAKLSS